ncbi:hypothetical protein K466DRAFT_596229 [Polyporus arcularius HHB13444]|uniref:Uncharacterized protein n=1 Tax=Polyporus arcularius HHB13444 TaxID=1314778 RepID=A0A5C3PPN1_9APHY|nr:hypothetical protein K466DRAFT_596229 [Polyporus arcularius HHB13444]
MRVRYETHYVEHGLQSATRSGEPCPTSRFSVVRSFGEHGRARLRRPASRWLLRPRRANGTSVDVFLSSESYAEIFQSPVPAFIILIPQSYYGLDVRAKEQFQSLVPPLDASNAGILVPKYHTFLEGLVHYGLHPPFGLDVPHNQGLMWNDVYVSYLVQQKVQYDTDSDDVLPRKALLPNEQAVLR